MSDKLPQKEAGLFKKIVRSYECKQYKSGLKFAKQVLSNPKCSEHGETLAMKGLILNCMGRKEEAYDHVKKGLRNDLKSHVCWHVFGLLQRSDRKYDEAIKCYRNALKWDKENIQILRDLSLLQLQMRDLEGFKETRHQLLKLRPTQRGSWIGLVLSYHLLKEYDTALGVLAEYRATQKPADEHKVDYEYSEMIMYEAQMLWEAGKVEDCLRHITEFQDTTGDELAVKEMLGSIYLSKGNVKEAQKIYFELISRNTENRLYYDMLERCLSLSDEEKRLKLYSLLQKKFPNSGLLKVIPLDIATGEQFTARVHSFLKVSFLKGVPSIFVRLKKHYKDPAKGEIIGTIVDGFLSCLHSTGRLCKEDECAAAPSVELWLLHYLAQHYDHIGQSAKAVEFIDKAIDHTPTLPELYMVKAKIYKHGGDYVTAAKLMEEAQSLDTADRFINCKCCKYLMRVNQIEKAVELVALFTREGLPPLETLNDAECNWFETCIAWSYFRLGRVGEALKKCYQIDKHFTDIVDDQFDFHSYCMRKMTLRPYIRMLQMENSVCGHLLYFSAARLAIQIYVTLYDQPSSVQQENGNDDDESGLSVEERKKREKKKRKAQLKAKNQQLKESKKDASKSVDNDRKLDLMAEKKDDFVPEELVAIEKPLDAALKFLKPLQYFAPKRIETHLLAYQIHSRRGKILLMLQAVRRAYAIDSNNPELHGYIVDLSTEVTKRQCQLDSIVLSVIDQTLPSILQGKSLLEFNSDFITANRVSLPHILAGCKCLVKLDPSKAKDALEMLTDLKITHKGRSVSVCASALKMLESGFGEVCEDVVRKFKEECHSLFPLAISFMAPSQLQKISPLKFSEVDDKENNLQEH